MQGFLAACVMAVAIGSSCADGNEACHFLGSRFAHIVSTCVEGFCEELGRTQSGEFSGLDDDSSAVSCEAAELYMHAFLGEQSRDRPFNSTGDLADELLVYMHTFVLVDLEPLSLGLGIASHRLKEAVIVYDAWTLRAAANDWQAWSAAVVPRIIASDELAAFAHACEVIVRLALTGSWMQTDQRDALRDVIRFYFDSVALMGRHFVSHSVVGHMRTVVAGDARWKSGVPSTAHEVVSYSDYIDNLARGTESNTAWLRAVLKGWDARWESATRAMIGQQIEASLCPVLSRFFSSFRGMESRADHVTLGVTLIDMCRPFLPIGMLRESRNALAKLYFPHDRPIIHENRDISFLYNQSLPWGLGMSQVDASANQIAVTIGSLLDDFLTDRLQGISDPDAAGFTDENGAGRALGRVIGLGILHRVDLSYLPLPGTVLCMLHPRMRLRLGTIDELREWLKVGSDHVPLEFMVALADGVDEALTPGGMWMFSDLEWASLFL